MKLNRGPEGEHDTLGVELTEVSSHSTLHFVTALLGVRIGTRLSILSKEVGCRQ